MNTQRKALHNTYKRLLRRETVPGKPNDAELLETVCKVFNQLYASVNSEASKWSAHQRKVWEAYFATDRNNLIKCQVKFNTNLLIPNTWECEAKVLESNLEEDIKEELDDISFLFELDEEVNEMESPVEFIKVASSLIKSYSGEPTQLASFISNVELVKSLCKNTLFPTLFLFAKGRLEGKALTYIPAEVNDIDSLINILKTHIKLDNSKVIEARLAAINFDNKNLTSFAKEVEAIADSLSATFISEGIPVNKANEMTISKVVETCRKSARNDLVKSVLASSQFSTPKEVVSKFVTEVADQNKDRQFLVYQKSFRGQPRGHFNHYRGNRNRGFYNGNNNNNNNSGYYSNNNHNAFTRGRGGYGNRGGRDSNRGGGQNNSVRVMQQENQESPRWVQEQDQQQ